jgi:alanine or glycine:cation symporter, AGCS family
MNPELLRVLILVVPLLLAAIAYTVISGGIQFSKLGLIVSETLGAIRERHFGSSGQVTAYQATMIALCGTVGAGSIVGVTAGILLGGPGAILWMWIFGLLAMALKYGEVVLAQHLRRIYSDGSILGGPFLYIARGLKPVALGKFLGGVFALLAIIAAFTLGNLAQIAGATAALDSSFSFPPVFSSLGIALVVLLIIGGGAVRIARVAQVLFPTMIGVYALLALGLIVQNIAVLPSALGNIFTSSFSLGSAASGGVGYTLFAIVSQGFTRGIFASSAGFGVSSIAHAQAQVDHPVRQGFWGVVEVFLAMFVSSLTALAVLSVPAAWQGMGEAIPAETVTAVFSSLGGNNEQFAQLGRGVFAVVVTLFAIATTIAWSLYAEEAFGHLFGDGMRWSLRLVWVGVVFLAPFMVVEYGTFLTSAEFLLALMAIPNIVALFILMPVVRGLTRDFFRGEPYSPPDLPTRNITQDGFESMEFNLD